MPPPWNAVTSFRYDDLTEEQKATGDYWFQGFGDGTWAFNGASEETAPRRSGVFTRHHQTNKKVWIYKA